MSLLAIKRMFNLFPPPNFFLQSLCLDKGLSEHYLKSSIILDLIFLA